MRLSFETIFRWFIEVAVSKSVNRTHRIMSKASFFQPCWCLFIYQIVFILLYQRKCIFFIFFAELPWNEEYFNRKLVTTLAVLFWVAFKNFLQKHEKAFFSWRKALKHFPSSNTSCWSQSLSNNLLKIGSIASNLSYRFVFMIVED